MSFELNVASESTEEDDVDAGAGVLSLGGTTDTDATGADTL